MSISVGNIVAMVGIFIMWRIWKFEFIICLQNISKSALYYFESARPQNAPIRPPSNVYIKETSSPHLYKSNLSYLWYSKFQKEKRSAEISGQGFGMSSCSLSCPFSQTLVIGCSYTILAQFWLRKRTPHFNLGTLGKVRLYLAASGMWGPPTWGNSNLAIRYALREIEWVDGGAHMRLRRPKGI